MKKITSVSQQRIADDLGVSQALVSMVLNGKRENISAESYQRIWDHALKIGYRPKGMQINGNGGLTTSVGFILRSGLRLHTQSNFFSHVQHGLHEGLLARGYHSIFLGSEDDLGVRTVQQKLRQNQVFGLAVLGQVDEKFLQAIKAVQPNLVAISVSYPGICHSVMPNEKQALTLLVEHLTGLKHRQFAWIAGDKGLQYGLRRHSELVEALDQHDLKLSEKYNVNVDLGDRIGGRQAAEIMLRQITHKSFPTAWICANGLIARGVINCLMQNGWRVPEEISVVAVDATRVCEEEHPQITGAHADPERIGVTAAELLLRRAESEDETLMDVVVPSRLTIRETSTKAAA
ncbi:MAG TPA: LacI family DNA-binding transcriptional regulator [Verrucomicrobiae bacterium]|nr:LacI family DNA-binding transcriptional regulator [Verrucomicrobiae bacterium]